MAMTVYMSTLLRNYLLIRHTMVSYADDVDDYFIMAFIQSFLFFCFHFSSSKGKKKNVCFTTSHFGILYADLLVVTCLKC